MELLRHYVTRFCHFAGHRAILLVLASSLSSGLRGVGLLMILPFLQILGVIDTGTKLPRFAETLLENWRTGPLPFNLATALIGYVLLVAVVALLAYYEKVLQARLSNGFSRELRNAFYGKLIDVPWTHLAGIKRSELFQNIQQDTNSIYNAATESMRLIATLAMTFTYLAVAIHLSPKLSVLCLVAGGVVSLTLIPIRRLIARSSVEARNLYQGIIRQIDERISMIKLVKSFGRGRREKQDFSHLSQRAEAVGNTQTAAVSAVPLIFAVLGAMMLAVFVWAAISVFATPPERVLILILVFSRLLPQVSNLQNYANQLALWKPALQSFRQREEELEQLRENDGDANLSPIPLTRELQFQSVSFTYPGKFEPAVNSAVFRIPAHQITALAGPSGAGKSTLADLSLGLLHPDSGNITVDGETLAGSTLSRWRQSIAYMPQEHHLLHDTIRANLQWAKPDASDDELWLALGQASAEQFVRALPKQLDTVVGERGAQVSGGERQRLSLARALMRSPALLVLDEPTSALDDENEEVIHEALRSLKDSTTILLIAHRQTTLEIADRVVRLEAGKVVS